MAEGRMLKKKISADVNVADLEDPWFIILFSWGIAHLDIEGRVTGNPREYKALVVPLLDKITKTKVSEFFIKASEMGLIQHYQVDGKWVVQFPGFAKNQSLRPDRESPSSYPAPPENQNKSNTLESSGITPGVLPESSRTTPAEVKLSKVKLSKVKLSNAPPPPPPGGNGDARPTPPDIYSCEVFSISNELFSELCEQFPLLPPEYILNAFPKMRDWCLDSWKISKHSKKFTATGKLKTPRTFIKNWLRREDPGRIITPTPQPKPAQPRPDPDGVLTPLQGCLVCGGSGIEKGVGPCKCLHPPEEK